jgi:CRP-like cAMP-binding protein
VLEGLLLLYRGMVSGSEHVVGRFGPCGSFYRDMEISGQMNEVMIKDGVGF